MAAQEFGPHCFPLRFPSIIMTRIINGKILVEREEYDALTLMQQLGMELKPKAVKKYGFHRAPLI